MITRVSFVEILTNRSFITNVTCLWFSFNLRFIRSLARFVKLETI